MTKGEHLDGSLSANTKTNWFMLGPEVNALDGVSVEGSANAVSAAEHPNSKSVRADAGGVPACWSSHPGCPTPQALILHSSPPHERTFFPT